MCPQIPCATPHFAAPAAATFPLPTMSTQLPESHVRRDRLIRRIRQTVRSSRGARTEIAVSRQRASGKTHQPIKVVH